MLVNWNFKDGAANSTTQQVNRQKSAQNLTVVRLDPSEPRGVFFDPKRNTTHTATLTQCDCNDFNLAGTSPRKNFKPCMHIYRLAIDLGLIEAKYMDHDARATLTGVVSRADILIARHMPKPHTMKTQCPECQQHIEADDQLAGTQVTCPTCQQAFMLPQLKTCHYTFVTLEQGTTAWREWRHNGIGASDASAIMGQNRFKSAAQLLQEKRGPAQDFGRNAAMARGTELEPEARRRYIAKTGRQVRPVCLQSTLYDWLRASLDGFGINNDSVVEIKCGESVYRHASQSGSVPDYYYGQLQHILAVTGLDSLDFWCYWPGCQEVLLSVPRDDAYIEHLLNRELEFWQDVGRNA